MAQLLYLSRTDVESLLDLDALEGALAEALAALSQGRASVPPRIAALTPAGLLAVMPGYVAGTGLAVKLVSVFPGNDGRGVPSHQGLLAVFDEGTGTPLAVMDAGHVTALRTAATSALAARLLARADARILAILGAGVQGAAHLEAVTRVRDFSEIRVASRDPAHAVAVAGRHPLGLVATSFEEAVRGADVVCCCTHSDRPVVARSWMGPGAHLSSVGSGVEVDGDTLGASRVFVEWRGAATNPPPAGAAELQGIDPQTLTELGEVLAQSRPGRTSEEELTVYKSTGHAAEDAAAAALVYRRALDSGAGTLLPL